MICFQDFSNPLPNKGQGIKPHRIIDLQSAVLHHQALLVVVRTVVVVDQRSGSGAAAAVAVLNARLPLRLLRPLLLLLSVGPRAGGQLVELRREDVEVLGLALLLSRLLGEDA